MTTHAKATYVEREPWFAALRHTAEAQHHSSGDTHGVSVKPSQLLALLGIAEAAEDFVLNEGGHQPAFSDRWYRLTDALGIEWVDGAVVAREMARLDREQA